MVILVTGAAGFIGYHVCRRFLDTGHDVVGVDNLTPYYDVRLKEARLAALAQPRFSFQRLDLADRAAADGLFRAGGFDRVIHLAAQPGVRYSIDHPHEYVDANLVGHVNVLEGCRQAGVAHLVYASSSSVYGNRPASGDGARAFRTSDRVDTPVSLYAATKRAGELLAHSYAHLHGLPCTGLRFFTVYGPWGRPDMAYFAFTRAILAGEPIDVYNHGDLSRDFTYVDDIVEGIARVTERPPRSAGSPPHRVVNIGAGRPTRLLDFIETLESALGVTALKRWVPMQPGDVATTFANTSELEAAVGFRPGVELKEGIERFVRWYRDVWVGLP